MTNMAHQSQLENRKYRSWVKAGLGLKYTKEGLEPFCDELVKQQHVDILNKVKQKHNLSAVTCQNCDIKNLQPDHVRTKFNQCSLGQTNCNCQRPGGKTTCSVCGAIYDEIIQLHASTPPSPYWRNTDAKHWCTEAWAVAKCFINAAGYDKKLKASEFDCSGLLHVLLNNMDFRDHLNCTTDGTDLLQKVLQHRNMIYHSHDMELEDEDVTTYLDDMIALLQDDKELINTNHSKAAVVKLVELKREDFVITMTNETEIRRAVMADVNRITKEAEQQKHEIEKKGEEVTDQIVKTGNKQITYLDNKEVKMTENIKDLLTKGKTDLAEQGNQVQDEIEGIGTKQKTDLSRMEVDIKENITDLLRKGKTDLAEKGNQVRDEMKGMGTKQKIYLDRMEVDIKENIKDLLTEGKTDLAEQGNQVKNEIEGIGTKQKTDLGRMEVDIKENIKDLLTKGKTDLAEQGNQVRDEMKGMGTKQKTYLDRMEVDIKENIKDLLTKGKTDLAEQRNQVGDEIEGIGTKQKTDLGRMEVDIKENINDLLTKGKTDLAEQGNQVRDDIEGIGTKQKTDLGRMEVDIKENIKDLLTKGKTDLAEQSNQVRDEIVGIGTKQKTDLVQKGIEIKIKIRDAVAKGNTDLTEKGKQVKDAIVSTGTKLKVDLEKELIAETTKGKLELEQKRMEIVTELKTELDIEVEQKEKRDTAIESGQTQHELDYNHKKTRFQKMLVTNYMQFALKVSSIPLQPGQNQTEVADMFASPLMVVEVWDKNLKQMKEIVIKLDEMFSNEEQTSKYVYILGEAGSGKSTLCKYLVYYWCLAHRELTTTCTTIKSEAVKEMEKYDFLFYISLRHFSNFDTIENMLDEIYPDPILKTILKNESNKCLILLDGLDEWTPQNQRPSPFLTPGLPARDLHADYTIITATRRWKFDSLQITDNEIHKKIKLKGITGPAIKDLTKTTVKRLNEIFHKNKVAEDFEPDLKRSPVLDLSHIPMILQQLICLWFDGKLRGTSKCSVYSSMLDMFFNWKALKHSRSQVLRSFEHEIDSKLPEYLCTYKACCDNTSVICYLASLAYKTLFNRDTKDTLTFSNSTFQQLKIPDDVKICSLNAGILSEDLNISLFASARQHSSFSFVHKTMQEFLAAVHIAMHFEKTITFSDVPRKGSDTFKEICKQFIRNHFRDCKTVVDILEQSNVFIMLCGLEPKLLPYMTEYIFNVIKVDEQMIEERSILQDYVLSNKNVLKASIQKRIISCIQEASLEENFPKNSIYIADIVLGPTDDLIPYLHKQIFNLHSVVSLNIELRHLPDIRKQEMVSSALKLVTDIECLKAFKCNKVGSSSKQLVEQVAQIIIRNKTTLECISVIKTSEQTVKTLVQIMPAMSHLISIGISSIYTLSHEINTSLCTYLEQSVHLQHIDISIHCGKSDEHLINLAQHKQLQYLDIRFGSMLVTSFNTNSLHICKVYVRSSVMMNQLCDSLYNARKLKCLSLRGCSILTYNAFDATTDTENLIRLLPTLTSVSTVELSSFTVTDNIITRPSDMKNLKEINLRNVTMSMATWCKFVDSLTKLPQNVFVSTSKLIIRDITSSTCSTYSTVKREDEARQYVREKTDSFRVTQDGSYFFHFESQKKTE